MIKNKKIFWLILVIFIILIDQYTKHLALDFITYITEKTAGIHTHVKKTSFLNIVLVYNYGISFGIFNNIPVMKYVLFIVILFITAFLSYLFYKSNKRIDEFCFILMISGAISNLIDRIVYGAVIDFLDFHIKEMHWPSFNIADSSVFIGVVIYIIKDFIIDDIRKSK